MDFLSNQHYQTGDVNISLRSQEETDWKVKKHHWKTKKIAFAMAVMPQSQINIILSVYNIYMELSCRDQVSQLQGILGWVTTLLYLQTWGKDLCQSFWEGNMSQTSGKSHFDSADSIWEQVNEDSIHLAHEIERNHNWNVSLKSSLQKFMTFHDLHQNFT